LADLGHYCDREDLSMQKCLAMAGSNYAEETSGMGTQLLDPLSWLQDKSGGHIRTMLSD
jgi:hypothetical protein